MELFWIIMYFIGAISIFKEVSSFKESNRPYDNHIKGFYIFRGLVLAPFKGVIVIINFLFGLIQNKEGNKR